MTKRLTNSFLRIFLSVHFLVVCVSEFYNHIQLVAVAYMHSASDILHYCLFDIKYVFLMGTQISSRDVHVYLSNCCQIYSKPHL